MPDLAPSSSSRASCRPLWGLWLWVSSGPGRVLSRGMTQKTLAAVLEKRHERMEKTQGDQGGRYCNNPDERWCGSYQSMCGGKKELDGMFLKVELKDLPMDWMWCFKESEMPRPKPRCLDWTMGKLSCLLNEVGKMMGEQILEESEEFAWGGSWL